MKNVWSTGLGLAAAMLVAACSHNLDPLSPGSTDGHYALGVKGLVPLSVGNTWTYSVRLYDTTGGVRMQYAYDLSVVDTVIADTSRIPLVPPSTNRLGLKREALLWYLLKGESDLTSCWQVDSLENLRVRTSNDARFYEQTAFNFRASIGDVTPSRYLGSDTTTWASGDLFVHAPDSVRTSLIGKGADTLRTTLGSAPYFQYRQSFSVRPDSVIYYFKPGFGLFLVEHFQRTPGGTMVRARRDELVSYYFR